MIYGKTGVKKIKNNGRFARIYHQTATRLKDEVLGGMPGWADGVENKLIAIILPTHPMGGVPGLTRQKFAYPFNSTLWIIFERMFPDYHDFPAHLP